jgi:hypothetical protein
MDDILPVLTGVIALALVGLAAFIAGDRARQGLQRAQYEKLSRQYRQQEMTARLEQVERASAEQEGLIEAAKREKAKADEENDALRASLDRTEYPFVYTVVPLDSRDMYIRIFRFTARHPTMAEGAVAPDPVAQWDQGRLYAVAAPNQAEARSVIDRLLPRHKGFVVVNAGEAGSEGAEQTA